jgi:NTE family protein
VLVFQGGGALGAYQAGVYQALHEAGWEPDWVLGISIGAINAALIAGNRTADRMARIDAFWSRMTAKGAWAAMADALRPLSPEGAQSLLQFDLLCNGLPGFFRPRWLSWGNPLLHGEPEQASCYDTTPLRDTLDELIDWSCLAGGTRLTVGAVSVRGGHMRYFDSDTEPLSADHVMASGALPPAFGAVRIDQPRRAIPSL